MTPTKSRTGKARKLEAGKFDKLIADSERISSEEVHGLLTQTLKNQLFNGVKYIKGGRVGNTENGEGPMEIVET